MRDMKAPLSQQVRRLTVVTACLYVVLLAGACRSRESTEEVRRPNILFCLADDASWPHMGAYGTTWVKTPSFDRIARQGLLFTNAYTPNAKCAPSRACILTGRNSWQLEQAGNHWAHFPDKYKSVMEVLGEQGYFTGHVQKGWGPGTVGMINGEKRLLTGKAYNEAKANPPTKGISKIDYAENFRLFLDERPQDKPFCFWYGSIEPHRGYEFGSSIREGKLTTEIDRVPSYWPDNDTVRTDMLDYALELEYFDQHLGKMLKLLEERGELDNTIIVVTADNGMPFPRVKSHAYDASNHLPLAIMWPRGIKKPDREITDFVSFIDFAPTFLELAGIEQSVSGMPAIEGRSLTDILYSEQSGRVNEKRNYVLIGKERHDVGRPKDQGYPIRGIVKDNFLFVKNYEPDRWPAGNPETGYLATDGGATKTSILQLRRKGINDAYWKQSFGKRMAEELYDLSKDRECVSNLLLNPEYKQVASDLAAFMEEELRRQGDPRMFGKGYIFDQYPYVDSSGMNFHERYIRGEKLNHGWVSDSDFEAQPLD